MNVYDNDTKKSISRQHREFYLNIFISRIRKKINALGSKTKYCFILHTMLSLRSAILTLEVFATVRKLK